MVKANFLPRFKPIDAKIDTVAPAISKMCPKAVREDFRKCVGRVCACVLCFTCVCDVYVRVVCMCV